MYTIYEITNSTETTFTGKILVSNAIRNIGDSKRVQAVAASISKNNPGLVIKIEGGSDIWIHNFIRLHYLNGERLPAEKVIETLREYDQNGVTPKYEVWHHSPMNNLEMVKEFYTKEAAMHSIRSNSIKYHWYLIKVGEEVVWEYSKGMNKDNAQNYESFVKEVAARQAQRGQFLYDATGKDGQVLPILRDAVKEQGLAGMVKFLQSLNGELDFLKENANPEYRSDIEYFIESVNDLIDSFTY